MPKIRAFLAKLKRPLYVQILFIVLAFIGMIILSYIFSRNIVRANLISNTENVLAFGEAKLEADLRSPRTMLDFVSEIVRDMILGGTSVDALQDYFNTLAGYFSKETELNFNGFYGYFETLQDEPVFIDSLNRVLPDNFSPRMLPWYEAAILAGNRIAVTHPYLNSTTGEISFAYTRRLFDDAGLPLGIVCLDVRINDTLEYIIETALAQGGYGMLLGQDLTILAHPEKRFVGYNAATPFLNLLGFIDEMKAGQDIYERSLVSYQNEPSIAFFRKLPNGFYLGLLTPKGPYYQSVTTMTTVLAVVGTLLAIGLIFILTTMIRIDAAKEKSDMESIHKSTFLANMSHEIRTPMNAIIGMAMIGKSSAEPERMDYCLRKIDDASQHLLGIINDILDMSKIEANKFELSPAEFDFEKMLQRIVTVINFRLDEKHQKLMIHIDPAIPNILVGDDQRLAQVITNLVGNAVKFTPENGSIYLNTQLLNGSPDDAENLIAKMRGLPVEEDGVCSILFSVKDTGIGISPDQQKRLFKSFQQADSDTTRKYGGTGLGLAISKNIVEMMDGRIWVESGVDKGSTFSFIVKLKRSENKKPSALAKYISWKGIRVMVVDDDPDVLLYFRELMREFKLECDTASSSEEAMNLIKQKGPYNIYFVDWVMPKTDGLVLSKELRAESLTPEDTVIIMISAEEWRTIEKDARGSGVNMFLSKPLFPSTIANAINEALGISSKKPEEERRDITGIFAGYHILLTEDVDINREIVMSLLEPTQLKIDCAHNGEEAVSTFGNDPVKYDLVLMDLQMPEMDGFEAARLIRALELPFSKETPIIAMTANVFKEDIEKCLAAGMNDHLGKPLDFDEVLEKLIHYLPPKKKPT